VAQALPASYRIRVPLRPLAAVGGAGVVVVARQTAGIRGRKREISVGIEYRDIENGIA